MIDDNIREYLLTEQLNAAVRAGAEIMRIYNGSDDYDISLKSDHTPITIADRLAHNSIKESLGATRIPILSEEGRSMLYEERCNWELFWLVDPLDGTGEFIKGNNEFTVNIALMADRVCACAVVYVPYLQKAYVASREVGSFLIEGIAPSADAAYTYEDICARKQRLPLESASHSSYRIAVSRSHQTPETAEYIEVAKAGKESVEIIEQGSSYKFCMLAEGSVDYYVRTSNTYEWDTAAGELILSEAGGSTIAMDSGKRLAYNKEQLNNPHFVCRSKYCRI